MTPALLRHDSLEDERRWAVAFGTTALIAAALVSTYDVDESSIGYLLAISVPATAGYWIRARWDRVAAWILPIAAVGTQIGAVLIDPRAEGHAFLVLIALFYSFFRETNRPRAVAGLLLALTVPGLLSATELSDSDGWLYWTMGNVICALFGTLAQQLRLLASELDQQRQIAAEAAVADERRRIARDVHDLVGHSLSVVMLHLTGARRTVAERPQDAADSLAEAEEVGRRAMAEIRRTIGMLDDPGPMDEPFSGVGDIEALVDVYRTAGLDVELCVTGAAATIDGARAVAAYRIAQEALVNATKHAAGSPVTVHVDGADEACTIQVRSQGAAQRAIPTGLGRGLVGMRERARSVGGTLWAGPVEGGWLVESVLPAPSP